MSSIAPRFVRAGLMISAVALGLTLAGCESFDPTDITNILDTKKQLPGERKPVFPEGTPGVPQGVPPDLVKGYQPPEEPTPPPQATAIEPEKPKAKPKPKPKVVAKPAETSKPTAVTVRPAATSNTQAGSTQWPDPPQAPAQQPQQPSGGGWSGSQSGVAWPDPPQAR